LLATVGHSVSELSEESCKVEAPVYNAFIEQSCELTGDALLGLHSGESMNLAAAGLIAQITQTSETVRQALEYCCAFANLGCSSLPLALEEAGDHFRVVFRPRPGWWEQSPMAVRHTAEGSIAFTIREFQSLTFHHHRPRAVHLPWAPAGPIAEYERVYGCPVAFNGTEIALELHRAHVLDRIKTSDYNLLRILVAHAEEKISQLAGQGGFAVQIRDSILRLMEPQVPTLEQVAAHLGLSPRTLQRRLRGEDLTFKQVVDELRRDFALNYLRRPDLSIGDIADLLSYADASTFSRSFKRWTGQSPLEYRQQLAS